MTMLMRMGLVAAVAAAITAGPALADQGGVPHNGGGQGSDHAAQPATPAQPGAPGDGAQPATPAQPATHAASHREKTKSNRRHGSRTTTTKPAARPTSQPTSSHAQAGKTTICHATGSSTNPYVEITISNNAIPAHQRHQDGRDIVPAPAGGCPAAQQTQQTEQSSNTSSTTTGTASTSTSASTNQDVATTTALSGDLDATVPESHVLGERVRSGAGRRSTRAATRSATRGARPASSVRTLPAEADASSGSRLPFTGWDLGIVAAVGAAMLLAGTALKRARRIVRVKP